MAKKETKQKDKKPAKASEDEQIKELTETLQRVQAEFENYKKRVDKESEQFRKHASEALITKLLPILDNFELALKSSGKAEDLKKGIEMIYSEIISVLKHEGLSEIKAVDEKFDPYKHEALLSEKSEKDNIVLEELQKGYLLGEKVLRHSKVKIGKKE